MLKVGINNKKEFLIKEEHSAVNMGSGTLQVLATPALLAFMEATATQSVEHLLDDSTTTVGISVKLSHLSADPIGVKVACESTLVEVDDRKLTFEIVAYDTNGVIGKARHERFIVDKNRFMKRVEGLYTCTLKNNIIREE